MDRSSPMEQRIALYNANPTAVAPVNRRFYEGLETFASLNLKVCVTPNGSMDKNVFLEAMQYFIDNLLSYLGADGKYSFIPRRTRFSMASGSTLPFDEELGNSIIFSVASFGCYPTTR